MSYTTTTNCARCAHCGLLVTPKPHCEDRPGRLYHCGWWTCPLCGADHDGMGRHNPPLERKPKP